MIHSVADVFEAFGGPAKVGKAIGKTTEHAGAMKRRGSIPNDYWPQLVAAAEADGISGVTYETLTLMHAKATADAGAPQ